MHSIRTRSPAQKPSSRTSTLLGVESQLDPIVRVMPGSAGSGEPAGESFSQLGPIVRVESGSTGNGEPAEDSFSHQGLRVRGKSDSTALWASI